MEGGEENREKFNLLMRMNGVSSDLLQKVKKRSHNPQEEEEDEEIELSLGLSMNGRFGVDPLRKKLKRSSSISNLVFSVGAADNGIIHKARELEFDRYALLARTRSLPTEAEEEWRRRKEFQSMRRMEARKQRMEKLKNVRLMKDKENCFEDAKNGAKQNAEAPPSSHQCTQDQGEQEPAIRDAANRDLKLANQLLKNAMVDMPYVSTKGDGPNGHRIEGFLYRYKKGEEVRIVCVCHGLFLTPAEFVKHGGSSDVEHPLKHIVVNPFPLL